MTSADTVTVTAAEPMLPVPYRVSSRTAETHDSVTLRLEPAGEPLAPSQPGQFIMLTVPAIGEVAISVSGDPASQDGALVHTIRAVGRVSEALHAAPVGTVLGARGPFGTTWDLRPVILGVLAERGRYRSVWLVAGARTPAEFLFRGELDAWSRRADIGVELTVDQPAAGWDGPVGFVTEPLARLSLDPDRTTAF